VSQAFIFLAEKSKQHQQKHYLAKKIDLRLSNSVFFLRFSGVFGSFFRFVRLFLRWQNPEFKFQKLGKLVIRQIGSKNSYSFFFWFL